MLASGAEEGRVRAAMLQRDSPRSTTWVDVLPSSSGAADAGGSVPKKGLSRPLGSWAALSGAGREGAVESCTAGVAATRAPALVGAETVRGFCVGADAGPGTDVRNSGEIEAEAVGAEGWRADGPEKRGVLELFGLAE